MSDAGRLNKDLSDFPDLPAWAAPGRVWLKRTYYGWKAGCYLCLSSRIEPMRRDLKGWKEGLRSIYLYPVSSSIFQETGAP